MALLLERIFQIGGGCGMISSRRSAKSGSQHGGVDEEENVSFTVKGKKKPKNGSTIGTKKQKGK